MSRILTRKDYPTENTFFFFFKELTLSLPSPWQDRHTTLPILDSFKGHTSGHGYSARLHQKPTRSYVFSAIPGMSASKLLCLNSNSVPGTVAKRTFTPNRAWIVKNGLYLAGNLSYEQWTLKLRVLLNIHLKSHKIPPKMMGTLLWVQ